MDTLDKILLLIKQEGFSEIEFTEKAGINKSAVTDWKSGKTRSYNKHIPAIAKALNVLPAYLLDDNLIVVPTPESSDYEKNDKKKTPPPEAGVSTLHKDLINAGIIKEGEELSVAQRRAIVEFLENNKNFIAARADEIRQGDK